MNKKKIPFQEVYDLFAIRIILDVPVEEEKAACWYAYSVSRAVAGLDQYS